MNSPKVKVYAGAILVQVGLIISLPIIIVHAILHSLFMAFVTFFKSFKRYPYTMHMAPNWRFILYGGILGLFRDVRAADCKRNSQMVTSKFKQGNNNGVHTNRR